MKKELLTMLCLHGGLTRSEGVSELKLMQMLFHFKFFFGPFCLTAMLCPSEPFQVFAKDFIREDL